MTQQKSNAYALGLAAISWTALILAALMILVFRHCQNANDSVIECVKLGQSAGDCGKAMRSK